MIYHCCIKLALAHCEFLWSANSRYKKGVWTKFGMAKKMNCPCLPGLRIDCKIQAAATANSHLWTVYLNSMQPLMELFWSSASKAIHPCCKPNLLLIPFLRTGHSRNLRISIRGAFKIQKHQTWEKFPIGDDPSPPYLTWDFFELGNFLKWKSSPD